MTKNNTRIIVNSFAGYTPPHCATEQNECTINTQTQFMYICMYCSLGLLSKSKGQILRVAACLQILFNVEPNSQEEEMSPEEADKLLQISENSIKAAINFVEVCVLHTALMAGRGFMSNETENLKTGTLRAKH